MRRLPVVATIRDAYAFAFGQLGGIIGLIWIPMVLLTVAQFFTLLRYYNAMIDFLATHNVTTLGPACLMLLAAMAAALLLYAIMFVSVSQLALGNRQPGVIAHFAFGPMEWRLARPLLGLVALAMLGLLIFMLLLSQVIASGKLSQQGASGVLMLLLCGATLAVAPRLLLLPTVTVNETAPALRRVWTLSHGNYLRLLAVLLALIVPVLAVVWVVNVALGGGLVMTGDDQAQMLQTLLQGRTSLPMTCGVSFFVSPVLVGLLAGGGVSAWRSLTGEHVLDVTA